MASRLSKATKHARKGLIIFMIFAVGTFLFSFIFGATDPKKEITSGSNREKDAYLAPDQKLGDIPYPSIKALESTSISNTTYSIQDRDVLPTFPPVFNVYEINKPREKLGNVPKANEVAQKLEIVNGSRNISDNVLLWQSADTARTLSYDKLFEKWTYNTDIFKERFDTKTQSEIVLETTPDFYSGKALSIISSLGLNDNRFDNSNSEVFYVNSTDTINFTTATNPRNAKYVYINQYKKLVVSELVSDYRPIEKESPKFNLLVDIRKLDYTKGVVNMLLRDDMKELLPGLVKFDYHHFNLGEKGVYNSLTSTEAFLKLQNNQGKLYWLKLKSEDRFNNHIALPVLEYKINAPSTKIIYIEPNEWIESETWTNYLQPYYLFEGVAILEDGREADFAIILPALTDAEYLK